jgi:predicted DNA-binding transcriptional regulator YafY
MVCSFSAHLKNSLKKMSMPKNKNQIQRYQVINHLLNLRKGAVVHISELVDRCNASERTVKGDIQFLRNQYDAQIEYDTQRNGYYYVEPFDLPIDLALTQTDVARLQIAVETLNQFQHLDIFKDLRGVFQKINQSVRFKLDKDPSVSKAIYFEPVPFYRGTEHIPIFLKAIEATRSLRFQYQSFKSAQAFEHEINPYFLQEFGNRWYVIGLSKTHQKITSFALERITDNPEILKTYFAIPKDFKPEKYFDNTYGMTHDYDIPIEEIILQFKPLQAKYFKSKPFHHYEVVEDVQDCFIVKMNLIVNYELVRKIVSMGNEVKVLHPQSLIQIVKQFFEEANKNYS